MKAWGDAHKPSINEVNLMSPEMLTIDLGTIRLKLLTANVFESGPMSTPCKFLAGPPLLLSCKLG